ncbi:MAG: cytochrome c oxidase subunit 3 [Pseudomonadales bacterium]|nr:cytochrome c oxidase subunit 3 [Pseudomonadales bacterium]
MTSSEDSYYLPELSKWPVVAATALFVTVLGTVLWVNGGSLWVTGVGLIGMGYMFFGWFGQVIEESQSGKYNAQVDTTFRMGMAWFIVSEVFFFFCFFACLFYLRTISLGWLGGEGTMARSNMLWDNFSAAWPLISLPNEGGGLYVQAKEAMGPMGLPLANTLILLTSGVTLTWSHWGIKNDNRTHQILGLALTVVLGVIFLVCQAYEYYHAYQEMGLTLNSGIYGATFYMLTGFHGFHVTMGTLMLFVVLIRMIKGHFTEENHFAFEGVAWYWHFVDVVWLGLYIFVYWL